MKVEMYFCNIMGQGYYHFNPNLKQHTKLLKEAQYYVDGILSGDRYILSEAITIVESDEISKSHLAHEIIKKLQENDPLVNNIRIAVTGAPGVGKSTFIEAFGLYLIEANHKVAVLAIDPSSMMLKGSIMGDKTRMEKLSNNPAAYIRPSSNNSTMGGVSMGTKDAITLCEYAGYEYIIIETVGVGQSEVWASMMSDVTLLLIQPGAGDEIQGMKRGIVELVDIVIIHKADMPFADETEHAYKGVLSMFQPKFQNMTIKTAKVSSYDGIGFHKIFHLINEYIATSKQTDYFTLNRKNQALFWFDIYVKEKIYQAILKKEEVAKAISLYRSLIENGDIKAASNWRNIEKIIES
jgi:LAO/AO transport system kinase